MEEALRLYFLELRYFVVRGARLRHGQTTVTDVDLLLYSRPSSLARELTNVDAKYKKRPQALERILWAKGLQSILSFDRSIVATTDKKQEVKDFGLQHGVMVLDGEFLNRLNSRKTELPPRLTNEELEALGRKDGLGKLGGDWAQKADDAKSVLLTELNFSGCNRLIDYAAFFAEKVASSPGNNSTPCRYLYFVSSLFLIAVDYTIQSIAFENHERKHELLRDGFRFGDRGPEGTKSLVNTAAALVSGYLSDGRALAEQLQRSVMSSYSELPVGILADYFSRPEVSRSLFAMALKAESLAFERDFKTPDSLDPDLQGFLGVLLDFSGIERRLFFDAASAGDKR